MVMITIDIAYVTCLVTNAAWHAYDVIGSISYMTQLRRISYFAEPAILWLAGTVIGEVGAQNRGHAPGHESKTIIQQKLLYC